MDAKEYSDEQYKLEVELSNLRKKQKDLEDRYLSQFPQVGAAVIYKQESYHISEVKCWCDGDVFYQLRKAKKDGYPSKTGLTQYNMRAHEFEIVEEK